MKLKVPALAQASNCGRNVVLQSLSDTSALKLNRETGMFSGPPWTSKCLQPALASMYRGWSAQKADEIYLWFRIMGWSYWNTTGKHHGTQGICGDPGSKRHADKLTSLQPTDIGIRIEGGEVGAFPICFLHAWKTCHTWVSICYINGLILLTYTPGSFPI